MGFMSRSVSLMRYRVKGEVEGSFWDTVDRGVKKWAFQKIESPGEEVGAGWTSMEDFTDSQFSGASYVRGNYIALSYRIDAVRVPPRILDAALKEETKKVLKESEKKRLTVPEYRALKEQLKETLKSRILPSIQVFDLVWDTARSLVYVGTLAARPCERIQDHFKKSFGVTLIPLIPYLVAEEIIKDEGMRKTLETAGPCSLI
jgi:DNA recombination-dependent growth factor C